MKIRYESGSLLSTPAGALIVSVLQGEEGPQVIGLVAEINVALGNPLTSLMSDARFTGKTGSTLVVASLGRMPVTRIVLAGAGTSTGITADSIRKTWGAAATAARNAGAETVISALPPVSDESKLETALAAAATGALLGTYRFTRYFGAVKQETPRQEIESLTFVDESLDPGLATVALAKGLAVANAVSLARDLHNEPASVLNPALMAEIAAGVASEEGLEITVLGPDELAGIGANAILTVGKGSVNTPRLIHLVYRPEGESEGEPVGVIGKCITFDTGGYSIKPYEGMLEMKGDMDGGAAVLGAMSALRAVGCKRTVHGVICAAENMISGEAFRPGDVIKGMNGVTMEILSTDAEGRLVLADGLVYTSRQGVSEMIDLATLTGAKVVALGDTTTALFSNNDQLASDMLTAARDAGESMWRMPLSEHLEDQIKGEVADIKNTGGRSGGAITAALFLQHFSEGLPWAHLDIAGGNRTAKGNEYTPKGATGIGVRTLLSYLLR